jgi:hypothetical protein
MNTSETVLHGRGSAIEEVPIQVWKQHLAELPPHSAARIEFMTEEHHKVRDYVVRELPLSQAPIYPESISSALQLPLERVEALLSELHEKLVFLVLNELGAVSWAFPVTADTTPHRIQFRSGEQLYAA